jgi:hypothetical protein
MNDALRLYLRSPCPHAFPTFATCSIHQLPCLPFDACPSDEGGGYEWRAAPSATPLVRGNTALELDDSGNDHSFDDDLRLLSILGRKVSGARAAWSREIASSWIGSEQTRYP